MVNTALERYLKAEPTENLGTFSSVSRAPWQEIFKMANKVMNKRAADSIVLRCNQATKSGIWVRQRRLPGHLFLVAKISQVFTKRNN